MKLDTKVWIEFLENPYITHRPIVDFDPQEINNLNFYSDAAKNGKLRFGCILSNFWTYGPWNENFIKDCDPSIEYLKLFGVVAGILTWTQELTNDKYLIHCDKQSMVQMLNSSTYSCKNCMVLIRILTLDNLVQNRLIVAKFIPGVENKRADSLSRMKFNKFWECAPKSMNNGKIMVAMIQYED